jgi:hypothetical protein
MILTFLLAYISCTGTFHCEISIFAYNVTWLDSPSHYSPLILSPTTLLKWFQQISLLKLYKYIKYIKHLCFPSTSPFIFLSSGTHPPKQDPFYIPVLHFFVCVVPGLELKAYTLSHSTFSFCVRYFWDKISQTICPGWLQNMTLFISASWITRITSMSHQHLPVLRFLKCIFIAQRCFIMTFHTWWNILGIPRWQLEGGSRKRAS